MKACILTLIMLASGVLTGFSQANKKLSYENAYSTSKSLVILKKAVENDTSTEADTLCTQALSHIIWYANLQDSSENVYELLLKRLKKYPRMYSLIRQVYFRNFPIMEFIDTVDVDTLSARYFPVKSKVEDYRRLKIRVGELVDSIRLVNNDIDSLVEQALADGDTLNSIAVKNRLTETIKSIQVRLVTAQENLSSARRAVINELTQEGYDSLIASVVGRRNGSASSEELERRLNPQTYEQLKDESAMSPHIVYQMNVAAPEGFQIPSETEMINALAIYLVNRMKKETVLWFFESISKNAKEYELVKIFFPNTIRLLQGNESFEVPNLGAQWQYAISKDFLHMPKHVLTSQWLRERFPGIDQYHSYIEGVTATAEYLNQRQSYRSIIRALYFDRERFPYSSKRVEFGDIISVLYAINNELFIPDSSVNYRMLKYEDYANLSGLEIEYMLSLLDLKYGGAFSKIFKGMDDGLKLNQTVNAEQIRLFFGKAEQAISRVQELRTRFLEEQKKYENGHKDWFYSTYSLWESFNGLWSVFNTTTNASPIFSEKLEKSALALRYTGQVFEIYNLISKKNFAGAVQQTVEIIDSLFYHDNQKYLISISKIDSLDGLSREFMKQFASQISELKDYVNKKNELKKLHEQFHQLAQEGRTTETLLARHDDTGHIRKELDLLVAKYREKIKLLNVYGVELVSDNTIKFGKQSLFAAAYFNDERHAVYYIKKFGAFLNDAALAQNDKQLANVVASYALPTGSYKRKRSYWHSLDLNAYAGPFIAYEWVPKRNDLLREGRIIGFSAPIGLTYTFTFGRRVEHTAGNEDIISNPNKVAFYNPLGKQRMLYRTNWTLSFTGSIVDLGAVVSYRLGKDSDSFLTQELKWSQFISPGFHVQLGIPSTPLVLSSGIQVTPKLRRYGDAEDQQYSAWRVYLGLFYDLPLAHLGDRKNLLRRSERAKRNSGSRLKSAWASK